MGDVFKLHEEISALVNSRANGNQHYSRVPVLDNKPLSDGNS